MASKFALLFGLLIAVTGVGVGPEAVDAAEGYRLVSNTVFRVDTEAPAVRVEATYVMTNTTPDRDLGGGRTEFAFFTGIDVPIQTGVADLSVQVDGSDVSYAVVGQDGLSVVEVTYASDLRYQQTATTVLRYSIVGDPPRTEGSFVRVNPAYVSFPVITRADEGSADVRIEVPEGWLTEYVGHDLTDTVVDGVRVLEATAIADPSNFWVAFTARNDDGLDSSPLDVGGEQFEIRSWPGDAEWALFVARQVTDGLPVLERLIGSDWPRTNETDVVEASTPYLRGYAGFFNAASDLIEIGEQLDSRTMFHELAHGWFNSSHLVQRWLSEGLAEDIATRAVAEVGDTMPPSDSEWAVQAFQLNDWGEPGSADGQLEAYGYATSFALIRDVFDEIGEGRRLAFLSAVLSGQRAYRSEGDSAATTGRVDWRAFLDLAEQIGGSTIIEQRYRDVVVTEAQRTDLDDRAAALDLYDALTDRGTPWTPPAGVRAAMASWSFDPAVTLIDDAQVALDGRDALTDILAALDLTPAAGLEDRYEQAGPTLDAIIAELDLHVAVAAELVNIRAQLSTVLGTLGLDVPPLGQDRYESDPTGAAGTEAAMLADADQLAETRAELGRVSASFGVTLPPLERSAFVDDRVAAQVRSDRLLAAAGTLALAHQRRNEAESLVERIGAIGTDLDEQLAAADRLLGDGDADGAAAAASAVLAEIDRLDSEGATRIVIAIAIAACLLLAIGAVVVRRRRGLRPQLGIEASTPPTDPQQVATPATAAGSPEDGTGPDDLAVPPPPSAD